MDLSHSYFKIELSPKKSDNNNVVAAENMFLVNNLAHSLFKQISIRLNGTLISPQMDTYHIKAYLEILLNYNRDDRETILKLQGWFNSINLPDTLTANQLDVTHDDFKGLSLENQTVVRNLRVETIKYIGVTRTLIMVPNIEVLHLSKLLIPSVQMESRCTSTHLICGAHDTREPMHSC